MGSEKAREPHNDLATQGMCITSHLLSKKTFTRNLTGVSHPVLTSSEENNSNLRERGPGSPGSLCYIAKVLATILPLCPDLRQVTRKFYDSAEFFIQE